MQLASGRVLALSRALRALLASLCFFWRRAFAWQGARTCHSQEGRIGLSRLPRLRFSGALFLQEFEAFCRRFGFGRLGLPHHVSAMWLEPHRVCGLEPNTSKRRKTVQLKRGEHMLPQASELTNLSENEPNVESPKALNLIGCVHWPLRSITATCKKTSGCMYWPLWSVNALPHLNVLTPMSDIAECNEPSGCMCWPLRSDTAKPQPCVLTPTVRHGEM